MTKNEYLAQLNSHLVGIPEHEKIEIILDFEEHFSAGLAKGKTEEEICNDLGDPLKNASQYIPNNAAYSVGSSGRPPVSTVPPVAASVPYNPEAARVQARKSNETTFLVLFILAILFAVFMYVTFIPVFISGAVVMVSGIAAGVALGSWIITALVISVGVFLMALSLLLMLAVTWLCIWLYKKYRSYGEVRVQ
ncbi:DUF1700 domain-containing protein [Acetanaerobacterium elongatum]|uniref:Uncharacterized membrane protein n=1 Tax=Acetanaerobacterium elongatum TaxID=258515 RepID=A0A1G9WWG3_9FIRM|nr:DUF1700 domain-containing protein [Acetanaerobacterium elongatum]SDM88954.1 Uncharacterized membrane protein [Acetanaerobacterium elongatum]